MPPGSSPKSQCRAWLDAQAESAGVIAAVRRLIETMPAADGFLDPLRPAPGPQSAMLQDGAHAVPGA